jgi:glutamine amidotransferase
MITIIDYGVGNVGSIVNMLKRIGAAAEVSSDFATVARATKLILPGVGNFDTGMSKLMESGLIPTLNARVLTDRVPILGVCLGMQLLGAGSEEGRCAGLGWIDADTVKFRFEGEPQRNIPHMGWNVVRPLQTHPLFTGLEQENRFYFVHSYHVRCTNRGAVLGETTYGYPFAAMIGSGNVAGVQFHPEKSHRFGLRLLRNFVEWQGSSC